MTDKQKNDKEFVLVALSKSNYDFCEIADKWGNDKEVVFTAVRAKA